MTTEVATCRHCGAALPPGARFCQNCGSDVTGDHSVAGETASSPKTTQEFVLDLLRQETLGEYEIMGELGRGGMATVYLAQDLALDRRVAIKVVTTPLLDAGLAERFRREARTAASLNHPHIIPIYAVRERNPLLYFVMKFIRGQSLDPILKSIGPFPIPMAELVLSQTASALGYAHRRGIIHRDVKPANIMLDDEGWVVVTDFGIAKVPSATGLTMTGVTVGTPAYMSPEQCMGREVTGASDQYSLGVVAYEILTGRKPFVAATAMAMMYAHVNDPPTPVRELRPDCPPEVEASIMRMLAKEPDQRLPGIDEAFKAPSLPHDDPTRQHLIALATSGHNALLSARLSVPTSPIPVRQQSPPDATTAPMAPSGGPARAEAGAPATRPVPRPSKTEAPTVPLPQVLRPSERAGAGRRRPAWLPWTLGGVGAAALAAVGFGILGVGRSGGGSSVDSAGTSAAAESAGVAPDTSRPAVMESLPAPPPPPVTPPQVARVQVTPGRLALEPGRSATLHFALRAADGSGIAPGSRSAEWKSSAPDIARVGGDGVVRALKPGRATISASVEGKNGRAEIEVRPGAPPPPAAVAQIVIRPNGATLKVGGTAQLSADLFDAQGRLLSGREVAWTTSSRAVSVSTAGEVRALAPGTAVVSALSEGSAGSVTVTVAPEPVASVALSPTPSAPLKPGETLRLVAAVRDAGGAPLADRTVVWASSDSAVASVTGGTVEARAPGTAVISATAEGRAGSVRVSVIPPPPDTAAVRARAEREIPRALQALVTALSHRSMPELRQAYPGMSPSEEADWKGLFQEKSLNKFEASLSNVGTPRVDGPTAEIPFRLHMVQSIAGMPEVRRDVAYRGIFRQDSTGWRLMQLVSQ